MSAADLLPVGLVCVLDHYVVTLGLWFGHWLSHRRWSPTWRFHVPGHHALYASPDGLRTRVFRYAPWSHSSNVALLPFILLGVGAECLVLPPRLALVCVLHALATALVTSWTHEQFHLERSVLRRFAWFRRARRRHDLHHARGCNFMVADHLWDRVFGSLEEPAERAPRGSG